MDKIKVTKEFLKEFEETALFDDDYYLGNWENNTGFKWSDFRQQILDDSEQVPKLEQENKQLKEKLERLKNVTPKQFNEWFNNSMYSGCIDDGYDADIAIKEMKDELLGDRKQ